MNRTLLALLALLAVAGITTASAQDYPAPSPSGDPHLYSDPAMTFTAPSEATLIESNPMPLTELSDDLTPVAIWVIGRGQEDARMIQVSMETYTGAPNEFEGEFESQTHSQGEGILIRNKTPMTLTNGMPASFVEIAYGSGFDARKEFAIVWADGQRGVVLSETVRIGDASAEQAQRDLKQATAVRYPYGEP